MGDADWWNKRFKNRELQLMHHEMQLEEDMDYFSRKVRVLDVACGDGRNAIYLARQGYAVTAIDFCEEALKRLEFFANKEQLDIAAKQVDLSSDREMVVSEKIDAIIINHFRLNPKWYPELIKHLNENGILWVNGFREVPLDNPNISEADILKDDDFTLINACTLETEKLYEAGQRKFVRYIWKKSQDRD